MRFGGHELLQKPFCVHPAQRMIAHAELTGIVGYDHGVAQETVMSNGAPDTGLCQAANDLFVEDVDALAG